MRDDIDWLINKSLKPLTDPKDKRRLAAIICWLERFRILKSEEIISDFESLGFSYNKNNLFTYILSLADKNLDIWREQTEVLESYPQEGHQYFKEYEPVLMLFNIDDLKCIENLRSFLSLDSIKPDKKAIIINDKRYIALLEILKDWDIKTNECFDEFTPLKFNEDKILSDLKSKIETHDQIKKNLEDNEFIQNLESSLNCGELLKPYIPEFPPMDSLFDKDLRSENILNAINEYQGVKGKFITTKTWEAFRKRDEKFQRKHKNEKDEINELLDNDVLQGIGFYNHLFWKTFNRNKRLYYKMGEYEAAQKESNKLEFASELTCAYHLSKTSEDYENFDESNTKNLKKLKDSHIISNALLSYKNNFCGFDRNKLQILAMVLKKELDFMLELLLKHKISQDIDYSLNEDFDCQTGLFKDIFIFFLKCLSFDVVQNPYNCKMSNKIAEVCLRDDSVNKITKFGKNQILPGTDDENLFFDDSVNILVRFPLLKSKSYSPLFLITLVPDMQNISLTSIRIANSTNLARKVKNSIITWFGLAWNNTWISGNSKIWASLFMDLNKDDYFKQTWNTTPQIDQCTDSNKTFHVDFHTMIMKGNISKGLSETQQDVNRIVFWTDKISNNSQYKFFLKLFVSVWCSLPENFKQVFLVNLKNKFKDFSLIIKNSKLLAILSGEMYDANNNLRDIPNESFVTNAELAIKSYAEKHIVRYFDKNKQKIRKNYKTPKSKTMVKPRNISSTKGCNSNISKTTQVFKRDLKPQDPISKTSKNISTVKEEFEGSKSSNPNHESLTKDTFVKQEYDKQVTDIKESKNTHKDSDDSLTLNNSSSNANLDKKLESLIMNPGSLKTQRNDWDENSKTKTIKIEYIDGSTSEINESESKIEDTNVTLFENLPNLNEPPKTSKANQLSNRNTLNEKELRNNGKYLKFNLV